MPPPPPCAPARTAPAVRLARLAAALLVASGLGCTAARPALRADGPDGSPPAPLSLPGAGDGEGGEGLAPGDGEAPRAAPLPVPRPEGRHRVEAGQNVYRLSLQYGCEQSVLLAANGLRDARALRVGQVLRIPACGHTVPGAAPGGPSASGPAVAARTQGRATPAQAEEGVQAQGRLALRSRERGGGAPEVAGSGAARGLLDWPLRGVLYGRFGKKGREPHDGIDLAAPAGTPVQVAAPGVVLYAGEQRGYGHIVLVEHAGGLITLYAHNRELRVRTGQAVREREVVATVGESGRTSGPHLHFEVRRDGVAVDPLPYLGPPPPAGS